MFLVDYVAEIQRLTVALQEAFERLKNNADDEALHEYRVIVRRIRSIIAPLRKLPENQALRGAAKAVGQLTTPARDLEVLIGELADRGYPELAKSRSGLLQDDLRVIAEAAEVQNLFAELERWPVEFAQSVLGGDSRRLKKIINKAFKKHINRLQAGVNAPDFDRHQLRILVKRMRYINDAFPTLSPLSEDAINALKKAQSALGDWHDHYQWGLAGLQAPDLAPLLEVWAESEKKQLAKAEKALKKLAAALPQEDAKS
ncbi:MAG: CHAD domain-containing protein [Alcaligenaceae bacterium]|nr:CHAD domain-containing protein [Alcaligenaceae bacterium]